MNTFDKAEAPVMAIPAKDKLTLIKDTEFEGERPLYKSRDLLLENVTIHVGESSLKECRNIVAVDCTFEGKYPFWETNGFIVRNCLFRPGARSALWYSHNMEMLDTLVEAPKMFRDSSHLYLRNVRFPDAQETFWHCSHVKLEDVEVSKGDYLFMDSDNIEIERYKHQGNYAFQYARNVIIRDAFLDSKDALWNTENVTVINSTIDGEYLAWYSKNLHLINCHIGGTQPLCYCEGLVLENCTFADDADLAFEYSRLNADIRGHVVSVKNPTSGRIIADSIGETIIDENILPPADCSIEQR